MRAIQIDYGAGHRKGLPGVPVPGFSSRLSRLFDELDADERELFLSKCTRHEFKAGQDLFTQGEPYTRSYLIFSGSVKTYYVAPSGKEITLPHWSDGALIGEPNGLRERHPYIWSAQAVDEVVAEQIGGQDLEDLSMRLPRLARYLIEALVWKLYIVSELLQSMGTQSVPARVADLLLKLGEEHGVLGAQGLTIGKRFSHDELGHMVGATRVWVTQAMLRLKREGLITTKGRDIVILDLNGLRRKNLLN